MNFTFRVVAACVVVPLSSFAAPDAEMVLIEGIRAAKKSGDHKRAIELGDQCVTTYPASFECAIQAASAFATAGAAERDEALNARAATEYRRFLELAPIDDRRVARVKAILEGIRDDPAPAPSTRIVLAPRAQHQLKVAGISRIAIGNAAVVDVKTIGGNALQLIGGTPGTTTLMIWSADGKVTSLEVTVKKE